MVEKYANGVHVAIPDISQGHDLRLQAGKKLQGRLHGVNRYPPFRYSSAAQLQLDSPSARVKHGRTGFALEATWFHLSIQRYLWRIAGDLRLRPAGRRAEEQPESRLVAIDGVRA